MLRVALVGCGRIAKTHFEALDALRKEGLAELVSTCDVVPGKGDYTDMRRMLSEVESDLVVLCTPSGVHPAQAVLAARAGRHVLTEKPFGCRVADCEEAIAAADQAGVHLLVVKQNRFNPSVLLLRKAFEAGRFGRIYMILSNVLWSRPQEYYDQARWRGTWEFDGGCLSNQAAHYVDMVQWFGGAVDSVEAAASTQRARIEAEDTISVSIRFRSGAIGSINATVLTYNKNFEGSLTILGERGTVRLSGVAMNSVEHWEFADANPMDDEIEQARTNPPSVYGHGHLPYYRHVLDVLAGRAEGLCTAREGLKTVKIIQAAYASAESRWQQGWQRK